MEIHPTNKNEVAWTSWMPALGYALGASTGPGLEIGVGHFSTPFLHDFCKGAKRELWSIEDNLDWYTSFWTTYSKDGHRFATNQRYADLIEFFSGKKWGVVFIDNSPGGEARLAPFRAFIDHSEFIVVHDYHRENEEVIKPFLSNCHHKVYNDYEPRTLLASKTHTL